MTTGVAEPQSQSQPQPQPHERFDSASRPPRLTKVAHPSGRITKLPGLAPLLAWTVDDVTDAEVLRKYVEFAAATVTRITFFLNGTNPGWTEHATLVRPLVAFATPSFLPGHIVIGQAHYLPSPQCSRN